MYADKKPKSDHAFLGAKSANLESRKEAIKFNFMDKIHFFFAFYHHSRPG